jgi:uncharacterized protein (TIRG00374 family)
LKNLKTLLITLAKIAASVGIIGWLFYKLVDTPKKWHAFVEMLQQPKGWDWLACGFLLLLAAVAITVVRWWYLVRALGIDFSLSAAVRIGFLGYFFNFAPTGIAGGDLLKAWMLAKEKPGNRAKALASVVVDRIIGLYVLFLVAATGVFLTGFWDIADTTVHWLCGLVLILTLVSTVGIVLILIPGFLEGPLVVGLTRIPKIGHAIESLLDAIRIYRSKSLVLFLTSLMTIPVHIFLAFSLFLLAGGLRFDQVPSRDYFAIYPISGIASTIPIPAGPAELGISTYYETAWMRLPQNQAQIDTAADAEKLKKAEELRDAGGQQGLILALVYRISTILIAPIGAAYYFLGGRSEVSEVLHEAETESGDGDEVQT